jgi:death-on-curing protein
VTQLFTFEYALAVHDEMHLVLADPGLLASAVGRPAPTVFGEDAYPDLTTKVATLLESVVRNHALVDGNKRAGWALALFTLWHNDHELDYDEAEAFLIVKSVADGTSRLPEITRWLGDRAPPDRAWSLRVSRTGGTALPTPPRRPRTPSPARDRDDHRGQLTGGGWLVHWLTHYRAQAPPSGYSPSLSGSSLAGAPRLSIWPDLPLACPNPVVHEDRPGVRSTLAVA